MSEQIQGLYHISTLLRRPGLSGRYLRSTKDGTDSKCSHFADFDYRHVEEKILHWKRQRKMIGEDESHDPTVTSEEIQTRHDAETGSQAGLVEICKRLANANTRRREQLLYWETNADRTTIEALPAAHLFGNAPPAPFSPAQSIAPASESTQSETTTVKSLERKMETASLSIATKETFSTVALSDVLVSRTDIDRPRTIYAQSTVGNKRSNRVPEIPILAKIQLEFRCPYCYKLLNSAEMTIRENWKYVTQVLVK